MSSVSCDWLTWATAPLCAVQEGERDELLLSKRVHIHVLFHHRQSKTPNNPAAQSSTVICYQQYFRNCWSTAIFSTQPSLIFADKKRRKYSASSSSLVRNARVYCAQTAFTVTKVQFSRATLGLGGTKDSDHGSAV